MDEPDLSDDEDEFRPSQGEQDDDDDDDEWEEDPEEKEAFELKSIAYHTMYTIFNQRVACFLCWSGKLQSKESFS